MTSLASAGADITGDCSLLSLSSRYVSHVNIVNTPPASARPLTTHLYISIAAHYTETKHDV